MRKYGPDPLPVLERLMENVSQKGNCLLWTGTVAGNGYGAITISKRMHGIHRIVYEMAYGEIKDKSLCVCHTCDTPLCIRPSHLFLGTTKENMADMMRKGRHKRMYGETHPTAKLNNEKIRMIRDLIKRRIVGTKIAKKFNISPATVSMIKNRKIWNDLD